MLKNIDPLLSPDLLSALESVETLDKVDFDQAIYFGARDLIVRDRVHPVLGRLTRTLLNGSGADPCDSGPDGLDQRRSRARSGSGRRGTWRGLG